MFGWSGMVLGCKKVLKMGLNDNLMTTKNTCSNLHENKNTSAWTKSDKSSGVSVWSNEFSKTMTIVVIAIERHNSRVSWSVLGLSKA